MGAVADQEEGMIFSKLNLPTNAIQISRKKRLAIQNFKPTLINVPHPVMAESHARLKGGKPVSTDVYF